MTLYHNINVRSGHDAEHLFYIVQLKKKKKRQHFVKKLLWPNKFKFKRKFDFQLSFTFKISECVIFFFSASKELTVSIDFWTEFPYTRDIQVNPVFVKLAYTDQTFDQNGNP